MDVCVYIYILGGGGEILREFERTLRNSQNASWKNFTAPVSISTRIVPLILMQNLQSAVFPAIYKYWLCKQLV